MGGMSGQGTKFGVSALPATTYTPVNCTISVDKADAGSTDIDVTCLTSVAKEFVSGLEDEGNLTVNLNVDFEDAGYAILKAAKASGANVGFQVELPAGTGFSTGRLFTGEALVKTLPWNIAVDAAITGSVDLKISGAVVETAPVV